MAPEGKKTTNKTTKKTPARKAAAKAVKGKSVTKTAAKNSTKKAAEKKGTKKTSAKNTAISRAETQIDCINPATGKNIGAVPVFSRDAIQSAVATARSAYVDWSALHFEERAELLLRARDRVLDRQEELLDLLIEETGKVRTDTVGELLAFCDTVGYYAKHGQRFIADEKIALHLLKNKRMKSVFSPRGLILNIAPWNFPLDLAINPTVPALLAGNVAIIKPSELTPKIALRAVEIMREGGLPKGVLQVVTGYGQTGADLIDHADFVTFTGSVETGRKVAVACAERLLPYTLELGGKDPFIVLEDADLGRASKGACWGAFVNSGQVCMSVERVYVVDSCYDEFVGRVVDVTNTLRQGGDGGYDQDIGSMTDPRQIATVEAHIADAVAKGAKVLTGGARNAALGGHYFSPTVLVDVDESMDILTDETFGPILPIRRVADADEAVALANNSRYGLNASIWTQNKDLGQVLARKLESGAVCINDCLISYEAIEAPYGGIKESGIGRRKGPGEIRKYCNQKTIMEDLFGLAREPIWFPYSKSTAGKMAAGLKVLYRRGVGQKLRAVRGLFGT